MPLALGKYERYVRATTFLLEWLLRAHEHIHPRTPSPQLQTLSGVVQQVARDPTSLRPEHLLELPKVLKAFHCAIELRDRVTPLLANSKAPFATLLKIWSSLLQRVPLKNGNESRMTSDWEEEEDGYCPEEETFIVDPNPSTKLKSVCTEAYKDDLGLDVAFFVSDLEQLVRGVFHCYDFVKEQTSTLLEATVSVKLAMDAANDLTMKLQTRHPEIRTTRELFDVVYKQAPSLIALSRKVCKDFQAKFERGEPYKPWPFELLGTFQMILATFETFASALPSQRKTDGIFLQNVVERYREDRTPQYMYSDPFDVSAFLMQQLPLVYNEMRAKEKASGAGYDRSKLEGSFLGLLDDFFTTRQVSIPLVFACTCWIKSVLALQGNGGLGRNVAVMLKHATNLMERMEGFMLRPSVLLHIQEPLNTDLQESRGHILERFNPVLAGMRVLDLHLDYLRRGSDMLPSASIFRAFGHLYNALVAEGLLDRIPFFEDVLEIYKEMIFTPSRSAAIHGAYDRMYFLNLAGNSGSSQSGMLHGVEWPKQQEGLYLHDVSLTWQLLVEGNTSGLRRTSLVQMLYLVEAQTELFETHVLSRDMLVLITDIVDVFSKLCEELGQQQYFDEYMNKQLLLPGKTREDCIPDALENSVMRPLLPLLDALQPNGSLKMDTVPKRLSSRWEGKMNGDRVREMGKRAGTIISASFDSPYTLSCEQKYFTFPSKPDLANQEYGAASFKAKTPNAGRERAFTELMQLMSQSSGRLYEDDLDHLKTEIARDPQLLGLTTPRNKNNRDDLCTLLHQAAAGPAHDPDLVEWMIHLGALFLQPTTHCREEKDLASSRECLPNFMAVHSAAIKGYTDIVAMILAADNLVDLNTPTFHTKETIAHLAVKNGHRGLYKMLCSFGADFAIKDKAGNPVWTVTTNSVWSRKIKAEARRTEKIEARQSRRGGGQENHPALENTRSDSGSSAKKKTKKKKSKSKQ